MPDLALVVDSPEALPQSGPGSPWAGSPWVPLAVSV